MILLNGSNIKKMFLDETLFDSVSFNVDSNDKIGFIGVNGAGKSTLFKIITGDMDYDEGEIFKNKGLRVGYLDQYSVNGSEKSIWEETLTVFADVIEMENQLDEIRFDIENNNGNIDELVKRQTSLQEAFAERDGFYYKSKVKSTLTGLGFSEDEFDFGDTGAEEPGMVRLFINIGKKQKARPGDILGALAGESGMPGKLIGTIDMFDKYTFVEVPKEYARDVLHAMQNVKIKGKSIAIEPANQK